MNRRANWRNGRGTTTYKASAMDMLRSDSRIICALGPADFGGIDRVRTRLHTLAAAGPAARLGLRITPSSQKWAYEPDRVCTDVEASPPIMASDIADSLVELASTSSTEVPLRARLAGEYLLLDLSHGLSDAALPVELYAYLAAPDADPPLPAWATAKVVHNPLPRTFTSWLLRNPRKVIDVLYGRLRPRRSAVAVDTAAASEPHLVPWTRSPAVATATSPVGTPAALREWRTSTSSDVSVPSMLCGAIATAMIDHGIPVAPSATFLFDCRRYLRRKGLVLGNFAVGIDFRELDPTSPPAVHNAITQAIDSGRPLAAGALSALLYLRTQSALPATAADSVSADADAWLTFSDVGRLRQVESIAWTDEPDQCQFYPLSEPAHPETIVITSMQIRDTFHVSASFHDNVFDVKAVQAALDIALSDPIAVLSSQE